MTSETDSELAALRYLDQAKVLNDSATRENMLSATECNKALVRLYEQRAYLRATFRFAILVVLALTVVGAIYLMVKF